MLNTISKIAKKTGSWIKEWNTYKWRNFETAKFYYYDWHVVVKVSNKALPKREFADSGKFITHLKWRYFLTGKPCLPFLDFYVTTKCTLNCKECSHYTSGYKPENHLHPISFEAYRRDLDKMLSAVDIVWTHQLVGGEPLLNKELHKMIDYASAKKQIKIIAISTNGTIVPWKELLESLKNEKVVLQLSNYKSNKALTPLLHNDEIISLLDANGINYCYCGEPEKYFFWTQFPKISKEHYRPQMEIRGEWRKCVENTGCCGYKCPAFHEGKLMPCPVAVWAFRNMPEYKFMDEEIIDTRNLSSKQIRKRLVKFFKLPYFQVCELCHHTEHPIKIPPAEQNQV